MWGMVTRLDSVAGGGVALWGENEGGGGKDHEDAGGDVWSKKEEDRRTSG